MTTSNPGIELEIADVTGVVLEIGNENDEIETELGDAVIIGGTAPIYHGETVVEPRFFAETILPTQGTLVETDIKVNEIRVEKVSSTTGGYVYYIGT